MGNDMELLILKTWRVLVGNSKDKVFNKTVCGYVQKENETATNSSVNLVHDYILFGNDISKQLAFICECGVAFLSKKLAVQHFNLWNPGHLIDYDLLQVPIEMEDDSNYLEDESVKQKEREESLTKKSKKAKKNLKDKGVVKGKKNGETVDTTVETNGDQIELSLSQLKKNDPYEAVRTLHCAKLFSGKGKVMLHGILHCSGLRVSKDFLQECAFKLGMRRRMAFNIWDTAIDICLTNADYVYEKYLTDEVLQTARSLFSEIMYDNLHRDWGTSYVIEIKEWDSNLKETNSRLLVESLFLSYGANIHWKYLDTCAKKIKVTGKTMYKWWKEAVLRIMLRIDNPYLNYINAEIQKEAEEIHESIPSCYKTDDDRPRTTNSLEVMYITDNHANYSKEMGKRWMQIMDEIYRSFGFEQSFLHIRAFADLLSVSESYVYRHWHESKIKGFAETAGVSEESDIIDEAKTLKDEADIEVKIMLNYQTLGPEEKEAMKLEAELIMKEIFSEHGVIQDVYYIETCATFLKLDTSEFFKLIEKIQTPIEDNQGSLMKKPIPSIQEKAYELHEKVMMCIKNAKENSMF